MNEQWHKWYRLKPAQPSLGTLFGDDMHMLRCLGGMPLGRREGNKRNGVSQVVRGIWIRVTIPRILFMLRIVFVFSSFISLCKTSVTVQLAPMMFC